MNADSAAKNQFNKKLLAIAAIIIVVVAAGVSWRLIYTQSANTPKSNVVLPALNLTLIGANGQQKILDSIGLAALIPYKGTGGYVNEKNTTYVGDFTGVPILTLLNLVGGITTGENVTVTASDGYQTTFTYQQVQGQGLNTYDPMTRAAVQPSQPLTVVVAYYCNGTSLASDKGPLNCCDRGTSRLVHKQLLVGILSCED